MSYRFALLCLCVVSFRLSAAEYDEQTLTEVQFNNETLYLRLCYIIGGWMENRLLEFVIQLKDTEMMDANDVLNVKFQGQLKEAIHFLLEQLHIIDNSMIILYKILVGYSSPTYYFNVTIIRALANIYIKLNFLANNKGDVFKRNEITVIQSIVEELYSIQSYLAANHPYGIESPHDNDESTKSNDVISGFLVVVNNMIPDLNYPACDIKQTLLANIVTLPPEDIVSRRILQSSIELAQNKKVKIFDLSQIMILKLDPDLMCLYQDAIMMAFMKLLYDLIIIKNEPHIFKNYSKTHVFHLMDLVISQIGKNYKLFPALMVDGFDILTHIIVGGPTYYVEPEHIIYHKLIDTIDLYEETSFEKFILLLFQETSFMKILSKILNNINDFKCFHESVKYRKIKHENHYIKVFQTINHITDTKFESKDVCKFVYNIFSFCYNALMKPKGKVEYTDLSIITEYISVILKFNKVNLNLYNTCLNIAIILVNKPLKMKTSEVENIFNVIIAKLNIFGTKHCNPKEFKFLFNSIIEYNEQKNNENIKEYIKIIYSNYNPGNQIPINYLDIQFIKQNYIITSDCIVNYGKNVKFFWKWNVLSISEVYMSYDILNLNPDDLNAFYNIYFKFYIAIVFYTFKEYFIGSNETTENKLKTTSSYLNEFNSNNFPFDVMYLVIMIKKMITISSYEVTDNSARNIDIDQNISTSIFKIENKLFQMGVQFENFDSSHSANLKPFIVNILKSLRNDLKNKVKVVNKLFSEFQFANDN